MTKRAEFESYFQLPGPRRPDVEAAVLAAADAYDMAEKTGRLPPESLAPIIGAVSSPQTRIWANCCPLLLAASECWPEAADAIVQLSRSSKAHVRFSAICSLGRGTPTNTIDRVLKAGLIDRSARVRWKAADTALHLDQRHLLPEIAAALAAEKNKQTKQVIEFSFHFLRDGYIVKPSPSGSYSVSARLANGGCTREVSAEELNARGIDAIVAEMRNS